MKISELKNAPQWLLDARTERADVEYDACGRVLWRGGVWRGGEWHGGVWRGGVWLGGVWYGDEWHDGEWCGGEWCGGVWHGGVWRDGVWRGEKCASNLWTVFGLAWPVTISPTRMQIGCELHSFSEWAGFDDERIVKMDRGALKFWRTHKAALMALCGARPPLKEGK